VGRPVSRWELARLALRRAGPEALANVVLRRGLRAFGAWQTLVFFERDVAEDIPEVSAGVPLDTRFAAGGHAHAYRAALEAAGVPWERIEARFAQGDVCALGFTEGRLVHAVWITARAAWIPELRARFRPRPGEAYVFDSFTVPDLRGSRVQPAVSALILRWARGQGHRWLTFHVRGSNPPAWRIAAKMGARRAHVVRCFRPARGQGAWVRGLDERLGPRVEFEPEVVVRSLGPLGIWVRERPR
jgi:hypothetical protein